MRRGISAGSDADCRERLKEVTPDLIVLDVMMPGQPGYFTLRALKEDPKTNGIPVIMLTGAGKRLGVTFAAQDIYDHLGYEPDVFLEKPIQPTLLRRAAEKLLGMEKE